MADVLQLAAKEPLVVTAVGRDADTADETARRVHVHGVVGRDDAGAENIEEMCPSPVARRLMMNRTAPSARFRWSNGRRSTD